MANNSWFDKIEKKLERFTLYGLMYYIAGLMIVVFILASSGKLSLNLLRLQGALVLNGQIWRIFTFLLIPISREPFFLFFELMILIMCANGIEAVFGPFKLTAYYVLGATFMVIASLFVPDLPIDSYPMYLSLFFGYATLFPDEEMLFMFIIPIKIKYLAYLSGFGVIYYFLLAPIYAKIAIFLSFANYLIFFAIPAFKGIKYSRKQNKRRESFEKAASPENPYRHKCSVCGRTDVSNPELTFRYCVCKECGENGVAFCQEHLDEHKKKKNGNN